MGGLGLRISGVLLWAALGVPAHAGVQPEAYAEAVRLVDSLYLRPDEVDAPAMLRGAASGLADDVHWLLVDAEGDTVYLRHGDGTRIGSLSVASTETLPEALTALEELVRGSGFDVGDVDVRLAILQGMTDALDRYSTVLSGDRLDRFDVRLKGTLVGVGLGLRIERDQLVVTSVDEGGPAGRGGVQPGDLLIRIDGVSTVNMPIREASRRIRGKAGSPVVLTLQRGGARPEVTLVREELVVPNVEHRVLDGKVGYVRITHFSQRTDENLRAELALLAEAGALDKGLIVDLRRNTGGSMKDSARSADQFVHEGLLLRTAGPDGGRVRNLQSRMDAQSVGDEPDIPVVVLMDRRTASGSEIMAGALVELDRAALVGSRSFGKGTVQKVYPIDPAARLKLTVARYLLAHGRTIDEGGLLPDVSLADVVLDGDGVRFSRYTERDTGAEWDAVVPVVVERESWRGEGRRSGDVRLELARRAVLAADGPHRGAVVASLNSAAREIRAEQQAHLVAALEARGLDWSVTDAPEGGGPPAAEVRVLGRPDPESRDTMVVEVEVTNFGEVDLEQAMVELRCDTFRAWDGAAVPFGRIAPSSSATGTHVVRLAPGVNPREDEVHVYLHTAHNPVLLAEPAVLRAASPEIPRIAVTARYVRSKDGGRAEVTVHNLSPVRLPGVEVAFSHPGDLDVELVTHAARVPSIGPRGSARLDLELRVGDDAPDVLPLELTVESEAYRRDLARWPLALPIDGSALALQAPRYTAQGVPLSAPVGPWTIPISVTDESRLDHVVVYNNGRKVAWAAGGRPAVELTATIELLPGENRVDVVATDEHGVRLRDSIHVRGEPLGAAVDAGDDGP